MADAVQFTIVNIGTLSMNKFWGETARVRSPTATCTLLQAGGTHLLVDPSPAPDLLAPMLFARTGLRPPDVDAVFLTHWHGDHRFGLELFDGIPWLMSSTGLDEWRRQRPDDAPLWGDFAAAVSLPPGLSLFPTPGHTMGHCSLLAETRWGSLVVAGDAVMTPEFFAAREGYHNSIDSARAAQTIAEIARAARLVIPGHGNVVLNL
jgi:glyoxylase-like metal-dependent hydrolase (beta-lactamase superfamily II)